VGSPYTTFNFSVGDGTASSTTATQTINVTTLAPTTTNHTVTTVESTPYTFVAGDFPFTDPDSDGETLQTVKVLSLPTGGTFTDNGSAVTVNHVIPVADVTAAHLPFTPPARSVGSPYTTFNFSVGDGTASS